MTEETTKKLELQYMDELVNKVFAEGLELKKNASLLGLGGGDWKFGKQIASRAEAMHYIYADDDQEQLALADEEEILTTYCAITDTEQVKKDFHKILP